LDVLPWPWLSQVIPFEAGRSSNFLAATPVAVDFDGDGQLDAGMGLMEGRKPNIWPI